MSSFPSAVLLRPAAPADAEAGARLHARCWSEAYADLIAPERLERVVAAHDERVAMWERMVTGAHPPLLAVRSGLSGAEELVGFATAGPTREVDAPAPLHLYALYVRRSAWGSGVGAALLGEVTGGAACSLWVLADNPRAHAFYAKHGFAPDGTTLHDADIDAHEVRLVRPGRTGAVPAGAGRAQASNDAMSMTNR
ncbi:GNAT family N-acetyltransferase [Nocardioides zeae]|uniref:GNAT family N-acetyltransferase n=1 Tax=Nocardioides imazamoxiresistens TaxID=3231893 RepID=A0ABU3PZZ1_9ACTN|nr:GNAT family N-acetyltransferase [Nocardioides zeae]MDT9594828.1 GNAT family N-acetyltransferase [Nocardioides zeae]